MSAPLHTLRSETVLLMLAGAPTFGTLELARDGDEDGRWVTVDGSHIFIKGGRITKGPPALVGKSAKIHPVSSSQHGGHAPAGGVVHESNGQEYRGGQRLPTTGERARPASPLFTGQMEHAAPQGRLFGQDEGAKAAARAAGKGEADRASSPIARPPRAQSARDATAREVSEGSMSDLRALARKHGLDDGASRMHLVQQLRDVEVRMQREGSLKRGQSLLDTIEHGTSEVPAPEAAPKTPERYDADKAGTSKTGKGLFNQTVVDPATGTKQSEMFDTGAARPVSEPIKGSKSALDPANTSPLPFAEKGEEKKAPTREEIDAAIKRHKAKGLDTAQAVAAAHRELGIGHQPAPKAERAVASRPVTTTPTEPSEPPATPKRSAAAEQAARVVAKRKGENANQTPTEPPKATEPLATPSDAGKAAAERASGLASATKPATIAPGVSTDNGVGRTTPPQETPKRPGAKDDTSTGAPAASATASSHPVSVVSDNHPQFPSAPVESIRGKDLGEKVNVLPNGHVQYVSPGWGSTPGQQRDLIRQAVADHFKQKVQAKHAEKFGPGYWRATNNKAEPELMRKGELRPSVNHADNTTEKGLSVADGLHYSGMMGYKHVYRVNGPIVGTGADGETLLHPTQSTPGKVFSGKAKDQLLDWDRNALHDAIREEGWTPEIYKAITTTPNPVSSDEFHRHAQVQSHPASSESFEPTAPAVSGGIPSDAGTAAASRAARLHAEAEKQRTVATRSATPEYHEVVAKSLDERANAAYPAPIPLHEVPREVATDGPLGPEEAPEAAKYREYVRKTAAAYRAKGNEKMARAIEGMANLPEKAIRPKPPGTSEAAKVNAAVAEHKPYGSEETGKIDFDREFGSSAAVKSAATEAKIRAAMTKPAQQDEGSRAAARAAGLNRTPPMTRSTFPVSGPAGKAVVVASGGHFLTKTDAGETIHVGTYESALAAAKEHVTNREPWQMTADEYTTSAKPKEYDSLHVFHQHGLSRRYLHEHEMAVRGAVKAGRPVPARVLADYPDLTKKPA